MKKTILLFAVILTAFTAVNAQKKSQKLIEGTVSYSKSTGADASYGLRPTIGYFVTDNVAVGVLGEVSKSGTDKTTNVGAFGRCYFMSVGQHCRVFSQLDVTSNSSTNAADVKTTSVSSNLGLGATYSLNSKLSLIMNVCDLISYENQDSHSTFSVGFGGVNNPLSATKFGLSYRF